jgi:hypothetical protein
MVQRPADDEDLPNAWGLPAASLRGDETWVDAAKRIGKEKLGVDLTVGTELQHGNVQRKKYTLEMKLFEASMRGVPLVPQTEKTVTQYQDWKWGSAKDLEPAAERGSLCCILFLRTRE